MGKAKKHIRIFLFVSLFNGAFSIQAQELIRGMVVDSATFSALPYVNVQVKNQARGTMTDEKGNFSIQATRQDTLVFTLVGYQRFELPLVNYEASMIRLTEKYILLEEVTISELRRGENPYEGMFEEQNARLEKSIPFYFSKAKKEKIKVQSLIEENLRVKTYIDVVINNADTKERLIKKYSLNEDEYYTILTEFNEKHYRVMYYLTPAELISLLNTFYESRALRK
jgi:hypothetical protein